jgi:hypothetical protein
MKQGDGFCDCFASRHNYKYQMFLNVAISLNFKELRKVSAHYNQ